METVGGAEQLSCACLVSLREGTSQHWFRWPNRASGCYEQKAAEAGALVKKPPDQGLMSFHVNLQGVLSAWSPPHEVPLAAPSDPSACVHGAEKQHSSRHSYSTRGSMQSREVRSTVFLPKSCRFGPNHVS